jgi:hypothetical protein
MCLVVTQIVLMLAPPAGAAVMLKTFGMSFRLPLGVVSAWASIARPSLLMNVAQPDNDVPHT